MENRPDPIAAAERILTPARRSYLYRVAIALLPLLVAVGAVEEGLAGNIALVAAAVLGIGVPVVANAHVQR